MRVDLLGLALDDALQVLAREGIEPQVTLTSAPRRTQETRGMLRVVDASDDGRRLSAARFLDPIAEQAQS